MKKLIFALALLVPLATFGATTFLKEYKTWDNFASLSINQSNVVNFIKIDDPSDETIKCYVAVSNSYTDRAYVSDMSCVKVK